MKIIYIDNARLPTEKAHGIQIAKMCEAFADNGAEVELVLPRRFNLLKEDLFSFYGVRKNFSVKRLPCLDLLWLPFFKLPAFLLESWTFALSVGWYLRRADHPASPIGESVPPNLGGAKFPLLGKEGRGVVDPIIIYTRALSAIAFAPRGCRIVHEAHSLPRRTAALFRALLKKVSKFVALTDALKDELARRGVSAERIFVAPDAVDFEQFNISASANDCRKKFGLPPDKIIAMYTGHLYGWKGTDAIFGAAERLPNALFVCVGGTAEDAARFRKEAAERSIANLRLVGHTAHANIPKYLKAADVLLLPNSAREVISALYTSPLKLFEYMASRRPIVASDLPSLREVLDESTAMFFTPDDAQSLADSIELVLEHKEESAQKADRAYEKVKEHTWKKRAERILQSLIPNP